MSDNICSCVWEMGLCVTFFFCLKIKFGSWPGREPNLPVQRGGNFGWGGGDRACVCVCICQDGGGGAVYVLKFPYPKAIFIFFLKYCRKIINLSLSICKDCFLSKHS